MKSPISEKSAAISVLDHVFKHVDYEWPGILEELQELTAENSGKPLPAEFAKFSLILASLSFNLRKAFDLFPKDQAERIFVHTMKMFEMQFKNPKEFYAISSSIRKYMENYNLGVTSFSDPVERMAAQLFDSLGIKFPEIKAHIKNHFIAFLSQTILNLGGKFEKIKEEYELVESA